MTTWQAWVEANQGWLWWAAAGSAAVFLGSLVVLPWLVVRMPADYFCREGRGVSAAADARHPFWRLTARVAKHAAGGILIAAGVAMLVLPGQGLLTLLMGMLLLEFPGKFALERRLAQIGWVRRAVNGMRTRLGHEPLRFPRGPD